MDTKEVLLLLGLIIAVLKDLVMWIQGQVSPDQVESLGLAITGMEDLAVLLRSFL